VADVYIAFGLLAVVAAILLLTKIKLLPAKSVGVAFGALAALVGWSVFREWRQSAVRKRLEEREAAIKAKEKELEELRKKSDASERELRDAQAAFDRERAALKRELLSIQARTEAERQRIDALPDADVFGEFRKAFGHD
jgi:cell division protein FtsB